MATSANALDQVELSQEYNAMAAMTDSGDHKVFTITGGTLWSGESGYAPVVLPNGIATGRTLVSPHASANTLTILGCTAYIAGVLKTVVADATLEITPSAGAFVRINSVTIDTDGAYAVVAGVDGTDTTFVTTRGAAGGPPYIPTTSIEVAQIQTTGTHAGVVLASEIKQDSATFTERYDSPLPDKNNIGDGNNAVTSAQKNAYIKFPSALDLRHTGDAAKGVYIEYYEPILSDLADTYDFVAAELSASVSSQTVYRRTIMSTTTSGGAGGFNILLTDGITDGLVAKKNRVLTHKHFADQDKSAYILTQGYTTLKRSNPASAQNMAAVTIAAKSISADFSS